MVLVRFFIFLISVNNASVPLHLNYYLAVFSLDNKSSDYDSSSDPEALEGGAEAPYVVINKMNQNFYEAVCIVYG